MDGLESGTAAPSKTQVLKWQSQLKLINNSCPIIRNGLWNESLSLQQRYRGTSGDCSKVLLLASFLQIFINLQPSWITRPLPFYSLWRNPVRQGYKCESLIMSESPFHLILNTMLSYSHTDLHIWEGAWWWVFEVHDWTLNMQNNSYFCMNSWITIPWYILNIKGWRNRT